MSSTVVDNSAVIDPDSRINDYTAASQLLIKQGYCILRVPQTLEIGFKNLLSAYTEVSADMRRSFSFPLQTDGFFPFGMEKTTETVDLCERFCYRQENRLQHQDHPFAQSRMYAHAATCEMIMSAISQKLINEISARFNYSEAIHVRDSSYLQICNYESRFRNEDRQFMQERHEDGDLITLVMATQDGLTLYPDGNPYAVHLRPNEVVAFTGSLLNQLSDNRIPYTEHSVRRPPQNLPRCSLIYFTLPELTRTYPTFVERRDLCLGPLANTLHKSFGNYEFAGVPSR